MKLSVSSSLRQNMRRLRPDFDHFPMVLVDDYRPAWDKFLKTQIVKELGQYGNYANLYIVSAFVSYISSIDADCWRRTSVNILKNNDISVKPEYAEIKRYFSKYFDGLVRIRQKDDVEFQNNDFIRAAIDPVFTGFVVFAPRNKTIDEYVGSRIPTVFKSFPEELKRQTPLQSLLNSQLHWFPLLDGPVQLHVGRARPNYLVFRYGISKKCVLFYGADTAVRVQSDLRSLFEKIG